MPSAATPALTRANADGRLPVARCSSLRSSISLTGAFGRLGEPRADQPLRIGAELAAEAAAHELGDHAHVGLRDLEAATRSRRACRARPASRPMPSASRRSTRRRSRAFRARCASAPASSRCLRRVCAAAFRPASTSPSSSALPVRVLSGSKTFGASGRIACSTVARCGSTSHSTRIRRIGVVGLLLGERGDGGDFLAGEHHLLPGLDRGERRADAGRLLRGGDVDALARARARAASAGSCRRSCRAG